MNKERVRSLIIEMKAHAIQLGRLEMRNQDDLQIHIAADTCRDTVDKFMTLINEEIDK